MNILFFGYWGANEGLSQSTINPHLEILCNFSEVKNVIYVSVERTNNSSFNIPIDKKLIHVPFFSRPFNARILQKASDLYRLPKFLKHIIDNNSIDVLICRTALAGSIGFLTTRRSRLPYCVESFEPHARYMLESGVWSRYSFSYQLQAYWERRIKRTAVFLMPVAENYMFKLIEEGVSPDQIGIMPCAVDLVKFVYNPDDRKRIRLENKIDERSIVGIYVGKFGGNYLEGEAFAFFAECFRGIRNFTLVILSPDSSEWIGDKLRDSNIPAERVIVKSVCHIEVPSFLSAADFAFALYKPGESKKYLSPIKVGEYWANGLPVFITEGVGDEERILDRYPEGGILFDPYRLKEIAVNDILTRINNRSVIRELAVRYRNFDTIKTEYRRILDQMRIHIDG